MIYSGGSRYLLSFFFCSATVSLWFTCVYPTQHSRWLLTREAHAFSSNLKSLQPCFLQILFLSHPLCFLPGCWNLSFSFMVLTCLSPVLMFYTHVMHQSPVFQFIPPSTTRFTAICDFKNPVTVFFTSKIFNWGLKNDLLLICIWFVAFCYFCLLLLSVPLWGPERCSSHWCVCSVVWGSLWPQELQPARLLCPQDFHCWGFPDLCLSSVVSTLS